MADDINVTKEEIIRSGATGYSYTWFDNYFPNNNGVYVYNNQGGQGVNDGSVNIAGIINSKILQVNISALDSVSLTIRVEGKTLRGNIWGEIYTEIFTKTTPIALLWPICDYLGHIRVGILKTGSGTLDRVSVTGDFITWRRSHK